MKTNIVIDISPTYYSNKNSEMLQDERDVGNEETDFRKKNVVLAENFEQETNCSRYRTKMSQSRRSPLLRNQSYLPFLIKQMKTMSRSHIQSTT